MAIRYLSGINVDSNTLFVDSTNNRVGIGTATPLKKLVVTTGNNTNSSNHKSDALAYFGGGNDNPDAQNISFPNPSITDNSITGMYWWSADVMFGRYKNEAFWSIKETHGGSLGSSQRDIIRSYFYDSGGYSYIDKTVIPSGNVGIGTTSPSYKLDVNGATQIQNELILSTNDAAFRLYRTTGVNYFDWSSGQDLRFSTVTSIGGADRSTAVTFLSTGNVGIGTTSPGSKLDVYLSEGSYIRATNASSGVGAGNYWGFGLYEGTSLSAAFRIVRDGTGDQVSIGTANNQSFAFWQNNTERMRIAVGGNVGIGTTAPVVKTHIVGPTLTTTSETTYPLWLSDTGDTTKALILGFDLANDVGVIQAVDQAVAWKDVCIAPTSAAVGIGNVAPSQKLHVTGNIRVTGAYYDSNNSAGTSDQILTSTATGTDWKSKSELSLVDGSGTANYVSKWSDTDTLTDSIIYDNGTNVGVGTTSPYAGTGVRSITVNASSYPAFALKVGDTFVGGVFGYSDHVDLYAEGYLNFETGGSEKMRITTGGSLLIGSTTQGYNPQTQGYLFGVKSGTTQAFISIAKSGQTLDSGGMIVGLDSTTGYVWMRENIDITFGTNNTTKVTIAAGGNVGIGTASPAVRLSGKVLSLNDTSANLQSSIELLRNGNSSGEIFVNSDNMVIGSYETGIPLVFRTQNNEHLRITSAGNVGIGTTAPGSKLDVISGATQIADFRSTVVDGLTNIRIVNDQQTTSTGTSPAAIELVGKRGSSTHGRHAWIGAEGVDGTTFRTQIKFKIRPEDSPYQWSTLPTQMVIDGNGNVGIGTTVPASRLVVVSDDPSQVSVEASTGNINSQINLKPSGTGIAYIKNQINTDFAFGTNNTERMRITSGGNVGIGNTSPTAYSGYTTVHIGNASSIGLIKLGTGSSADGPEIFSNATNNITFNTNSTDTRVTILGSNGNVGINTTNPIGKLQIGGTSGNLLTVGTLTNDWAGEVAIGVTNGNGVIISKMNSTNDSNRVLVFYRDDTNGATIIGHTLSGVSSPAGFSIRANNTSYFNGGNVGIGTTAPASILHVSSTGANAYSSTITKGSNMKGIVNTLSNNADDMVGIYFGTGTDAGGSHWSGITGSRSNSAVDWGTQLNFYTHDENTSSITTATQKMVIKGSGNVGIGTTAPVYKLEVSGQTGLNNGTGNALFINTDVADNNTRDAIYLFEDDGQASGRQAISWYNGNQSYYKARLWTEVGSSYAATTFGIDVADDSRTVATRLVIRNGNVGIGTTAPVSKLHVVGEGDTVTLQKSNSVPALAFLGTSTNKSVIEGGDNFNFYTGGSSRVYITNGGNVGIGTTAPYGRLELNGSGQSWTTAPAIRMWDSFNSKGWLVGNVNNITPGDFYIRTLPSVDGNPGTGQQEFTIKHATGNVGIGTTSPAQKLQVVGNAWINRPSNKVDNNNATEFGSRVEFNNSFASNESGYMVFRYPSYNNFLIGGDYDGNVGGAIPNIQFGRSNGTVYMHIASSNGNVGIGTTAPEQKLHVEGTIQLGNTEHLAWAYDNGSYYNYITNFYNTSNGMTFRAGSWTGGNNVDFSFQTYYGGSWSTKLAIKGDGNVGIGTTAPGYKLEVYGSVMLGGTDAENYIIRLGKQANSVYMGGPNTNTINVGYDENQTYNLHLNYLGYQASTTQYRNLIVNDGRQGQIACFIGNSAFVGIGNSAPSYKLDVTGDVRITSGSLGVGVAPNATDGRIDASNDIVAFSSSDLRLKENIKPIENALEKVKSLTGVEFDWKPELKHAHGYEGHDTGVIAQEVQEVMPTAIRTNDTGYLAVRYEKLIGLLIEANKELAARVEELESKFK